MSIELNEVFDKSINAQKDDLSPFDLDINKKYKIKIICDHSIKNPNLHFTNMICNKNSSVRNEIIKSLFELDDITINDFSDKSYLNVFPYKITHIDKPFITMTKRNIKLLASYDKNICKANHVLYMKNTESEGSPERHEAKKTFRIGVQYGEDSLFVNLIDPYHLIYPYNAKKDYDKCKDFKYDISCFKKSK